MKNKYHDLNSELTIVGLILFIIVFGCIHLQTKYNEYRLKGELITAKKVVVDLYNDNKSFYSVIDGLNSTIKEKNQEIQEYQDLKQLKDEVREFWDKR